MKAKNHNTNREKRAMKKRFRTAVFLLLFAGIVLTVFRYFKLVSKTVYEESVSHLTEVFHQSDNMLRELTDKNLTYLHMWGAYLQETSDEDKIRDYIENAQKDAGFLNFYFLSTDGNYKMLTGETGYLDLQENFEDEIQNGNDIVTNAVVPGKSQMLVFASPRAHGNYQGFGYDAIAIAYENSDIVMYWIFLLFMEMQRAMLFIRMVVLSWIILLRNGEMHIISLAFSESIPISRKKRSLNFQGSLKQEIPMRCW